MKACIQRVRCASVHVDGHVIGSIDQGVLILLGITQKDTSKESAWLAQKIASLRIFPDDKGKMHLSIKDLGLEALVISQFTLYGNCEEGRRPNFTQAAPPSHAEPLYHQFIDFLEKKLEKKVATGSFGAKMEVHLVNDGPVTLLLEI